MAYMDSELKGKIVAAVKPILAKHGLKAGFTTSRSTITMTFLAGTIDFRTEMMDALKVSPRYNEHPWHIGEDFSINMYNYKDTFTNKTAKILEEIFTTMKNAGEWFDKSDTMTDYFHTAFYMYVNVGKYGKPYTVTAS